jgi:peptide/nickel transport system substrate-binding protein
MSSAPPARLANRSVRRSSRRRAATVITAGFAALAAVVLVSSPAAAKSTAASPSPAVDTAPSAPASAAAGACGSAGTKTFVLGNTQDLDSRNPFSGQLVISSDLYGDTYDELTGLSQQDFSPTPGLATAWTHTPDGLTWTFTIRSGVKWSDGVPMTAADVAYTFTRAIKDPTANADDYASVKNIATVDATSPTTVVFHMTKPDAVMTQLGVPILPEHIWSKVSYADTATFSNAAMVGTGPFQLVSWQKGQSIIVKANKSYWGGAPKIDCLVYKLYDDEDAEIQALRKGEIDAVDAITGQDYKSLANLPGITRISGVSTAFDELAFNTGAATVSGKAVGNGSPASRDPKFRQAIAYAIDKSTLISKSLLGYGVPATSIIPSTFSQWTYNPGASAYTYDPTKAEQMLDAAGYTKGPDGYRIDPATHKEMNLRLDSVTDTPTYSADLKYVSAWLQAVGIKTTTNLYSDDKITDLIGNGQYDMMIWGWAVDPDPDFQLSTMTCAQRDTGSVSSPTAGWSDSFYCNPAYDAMYTQQSQTLDATSRAAIVKQMQATLYQAAPYIVLYYSDDLEAYNSAKWTGVEPQPTNGGFVFFQYGNYTYRNLDLRTATKATTAASKSSSSPIVWIIVVIVVVVIVGLLVVVFLRRRATADERE